LDGEAVPHGSGEGKVGVEKMRRFWPCQIPGDIWRASRSRQAGVAMTWTISIAATLIILSVIDKLIGLCVRQPDERVELDLSQHGQERYVWEVG
jgi:ammonia channel protein AmtB